MNALKIIAYFDPSRGVFDIRNDLVDGSLAFIVSILVCG